MYTGSSMPVGNSNALAQAPAVMIATSAVNVPWPRAGGQNEPGRRIDVRVPRVRQADAEPRGDLVRAGFCGGDPQAHQRFALGAEVAAVRDEPDGPQEFQPALLLQLAPQRLRLAPQRHPLRHRIMAKAARVTVTGPVVVMQVELLEQRCPRAP